MLPRWGDGDGLCLGIDEPSHCIGLDQQLPFLTTITKTRELVNEIPSGNHSSEHGPHGQVHANQEQIYSKDMPGGYSYNELLIAMTSRMNFCCAIDQTTGLDEMRPLKNHASSYSNINEEVPWIEHSESYKYSCYHDTRGQ